MPQNTLSATSNNFKLLSIYFYNNSNNSYYNKIIALSIFRNTLLFYDNTMSSLFYYAV